MAAEIKISLQNGDLIKRALKEAPERAAKGISRAVEQSVFLVEGEAKRLAPVNKQTGGGNLRQSIKASMKTSYVGEVDVGAKYAAAVHEGTRPHVIEARNKKVLANRRQGQFFGKKVNHPGTKAQPFLREAAEKSALRINEFFLAAIRGIIKF